MPMLAKIVVAAAVISIDKPYDYAVPPQWEALARPGSRVMVPFGRGNQLTQGFLLELASVEMLPPRTKALTHVFEEANLDEEGMALAAHLRQRCFCTYFEAANLQIPPGAWSQRAEYSLAPGVTAEQWQAQWAEDAQALALCRLLENAAGPLEEDALGGQLSAPALQKLCKKLQESHTIVKQWRFDGAAKGQTIQILRLKQPLEQAVASLRKGVGYEKKIEALGCIADYDGVPEKEVCYLTGISVGSLRTLVRKGLVETTPQLIFRRLPIQTGAQAPDIVLEGQQQAVYQGIGGLQPPAVALLQGVTGCGKTEVYIKLMQDVLAKGRSAMMLVPEIALTPQMLRRFCAHFQDRVAVFHSGLTQAQRWGEYQRVRSGQADVVLGTRSAVFAPLQNIGIIVLDEEQEWTYKSDSTPRYHAREVAKFRCVRQGALLVLGSATPAVESRYQAENGKYHLFRIDQRYQNTPLPRVVIADMRQHLQDGEPDTIGRELLAELQANQARGEQSVLFLNRRGNSRSVTCLACGHVPQCENCTVSLTYHSKNHRLMCHYCGFSQPMPETCPVCGEQLRLVGCGTQKVQEELERKLPGIGVIRMDADTTVQRTSHEKLLDEFAAGKAQVLLGTQMIAKGLDFANVTLVGVLDADVSLYSGDWRAGERTFSLLTQVVGRAGRRSKEGRAVIQTYTPQNPIVQAAAAQDYDAFYRHEIDLRQALLAPPFLDVASFLITSPQQERAQQAGLRLKATLEQWFAGPFADLQAPVLGPVAPPIAMLNNKHRFVVSFRSSESPKLRQLLTAVLRAFYSDNQNRGVTLVADINPYGI